MQARIQSNATLKQVLTAALYKYVQFSGKTHLTMLCAKLRVFTLQKIFFKLVLLSIYINAYSFPARDNRP